MTDLIPRDAKHEEAFMDAVWSALKADTSDLGKQQRILAAFRSCPAIDPTAIREAALKEAADSVRGMADFCKTMGDIVGSRALYSAAAALIGEMIGEKK